MDGDLEFGNFDITPDKAGELAKKYQKVEDKFRSFIDEIETINDDQALEVAKYLQTLIKTEMDPSMIAQLLDHKLEAFRNK